MAESTYESVMTPGAGRALNGVVGVGEWEVDEDGKARTNVPSSSESPGQSDCPSSCPPRPPLG